MNKNINNMDNLLKNSFEDFSSKPADNVRASVSMKVKKFNFFRFNFSSFNVFYLSSIILVVAATVALSSGVFSNNEKNTVAQGNQKHETINKDQKIIQTENIKEIENTLIQENNKIEIIEENNIDKSNENAIITLNQNNETAKILIAESDTDETSTDANYEEKNFNEQEQNEVLPFTDKNLQNSKGDVDIVTSGYDEDSQSPKIVYDTIITTNKITVTDTVKTEVRKEVKVKQPRRNRRK